jgi:CRP/FNR family transcriptional regulator, transcriptional activator FtrB
MRADDIQAIRALPGFGVMDDAVLSRLVGVSFLQNFPTGVVLHEQGHAADFLFVLISGSAELTASHGNSEGTVTIHGPGRPFSLGAVISEQPTLACARTIGPARALMIPASAVRKALADCSRFSQAMLIEMSRQNLDLVREINNQKLRNSAERLANWILSSAGRDGHETIQLPFRKRTLASLLGMTPENLSRTIASLEPHGVSFQGAAIAIRDADALRRLARPTALIDA